MPEPRAERILDQAAARLAAGGHVAVPVPDLAASLGPPPVDPVSLEQKLRLDERFVVLGGDEALPGLDAWSVEERAAYDDALRRAGPAALVLMAPPGIPGAVVGDLLRLTVAGLAGSPDATAIARAAEAVRIALPHDRPTRNNAVHHPSSRSSASVDRPDAAAADRTDSDSDSMIPPTITNPPRTTDAANAGNSGTSTPLSTLATTRSKPSPRFRAR
jgi:hypothetical protein